MSCPARSGCYVQSDPNPALAALRDIHGAPEIPFWPPAPGWWVIAALLLVLLVWAGLKLIAYLRRMALRRRVLRQLESCEETYGVNGDLRGFASAVNLILKRVALWRFGRHQVSALYGSAWASFLDESAGQPGDTEKWLQLAQAPYREQPSMDATTSLELARGWVQQHV